ncbi:hypothetical protein ACEPPN_006817 [Leptodophora sp. 'Broadleaf-Isolate-01']
MNPYQPCQDLRAEQVSKPQQKQASTSTPPGSFDSSTPQNSQGSAKSTKMPPVYAFKLPGHRGNNRFRMIRAWDDFSRGSVSASNRFKCYCGGQLNDKDICQRCGDFNTPVYRWLEIQTVEYEKTNENTDGDTTESDGENTEDDEVGHGSTSGPRQNASSKNEDFDNISQGGQNDGHGLIVPISDYEGGNRTALSVEFGTGKDGRPAVNLPSPRSQSMDLSPCLLALTET